ncbi:CubicO group peptidase (beta-lactamase class C family) [Sphingopyxis panaciterrae]|uniref:serine hydrolase domain-containing protein n=1 Tax=Sphingopyxis panaciterrae TaxID=363841 RepID=UPI00141EDAA9|nr:serine hydrolase domain-containing protein [Sphingopyxis panaciterrae]NIJ35909.1 CubicO group peptidase (beta-lactamase class C family) [Sphingopyxis panaciterrae]
MRSFKQFMLLPLVLLLGIGAVGQAVPPASVATKSAPAATNAAAAPTAGPAPVAALTKQDIDSWLDGYMPFALERGDLAGAVVVVVKDGQVLTQRGFGYADLAKRAPVDPERTLFRPGSVSKLFTWTAVMQEVEAGRIDLDKDVNAYLDFKIAPYRGKPVTMRQLMTHTSGFEEHGKRTMFEDPKFQISLGDYVKTPPKRIYAPGTTPSYSNYGTALAGYIVERVSKTPFDTYVERRIFQPLGMTRSTFRQPLPSAFAPWMATGYRKGSAGPSKFEIVGPGPAGALSATGADMGKFMIAHLAQGAGLMKPETARMMHDTPLTILPPLNRMELGFFETNINGRQVIAHLGDTQLFHTALHLFTNENIGIYMSFNATGEQASVGPVRRALFEQFADRYLPGNEMPATRVDAKTSAEHAKMLAGNWLNSRRAESNFYALASFIGQMTVSVDAKGNLIVPAARDLNGVPAKWVETAPFVWHNANGHGRLAAQIVDGKAVRWSIDGISPFMVFDRAPASKSAAWLKPALYAGFAILLITLLQWPVSALIRRHYKAPLALQRRSLLAYRGVRVAAALVLAMIAGWVISLSTMKALPSFDPWLWFLQIAGLIVFVGGVAVAVWNLRLVRREKRGWFRTLWAALILLAMLLTLYTAWTFGLIAMTVNY